MKCVNDTISIIRQVCLIRQAILRKTSVERIAKLVADPVYREKASERIYGKFPPPLCLTHRSAGVYYVLQVKDDDFLIFMVRKEGSYEAC